MFESLTILDHRTHNQSEHVMFAKIRYEIVKCCFSIVDTFRCTSPFLSMVPRLRRRSELWQATRGECKGHWRCGWTQWCDPWRNHFVFGRCQMLPKVMSHQKNQTLLLLTSAESIQCEKNGRERQLMSTRARLTMFGGWSKDPYLRLFIRRVLRIQPCSMARFGRTFGRGSGGGRTVPTKTCLSSLHKLSRPLREEKTSAPLGFLTFPLKSTRVLFKEIALSGKCKNTVICGKKSMTKNANVENVGSINNPPGSSSSSNNNNIVLIAHIGLPDKTDTCQTFGCSVGRRRTEQLGVEQSN